MLYGRDYELGVFRSTDDGRSFIGPVRFIEGKTIGYNVTPMVVLSDGTLMVNYHDFHLGEDRKKPGPRSSTSFAVLSEDGGVTFSAPRKGPVKVYPSYSDDTEIRLFSDPGIDVDRSGKFRDRVYLAWTDYRLGGPRILISWTSDRGQTWSEPKPLDVSPPQGAKQFQPALVVSREGVVGVTFYDTREVKDGFGFHEYFTASLDGGATFLPPVKVSTEPSRRSLL